MIMSKLLCNILHFKVTNLRKSKRRRKKQVFPGKGENVNEVTKVREPGMYME